MPRTSKGIIPTDPHSLRLVQQVPAGTPGAFGPDAIFGAYWRASRRGLNGQGGFVSVENQPTLNDASKIVVSLPPNGSDGVSAGDRFYVLPTQEEAPEPAGVPYFPGDEWIEVYRGRDELVAIGTPTDPIHVDGAAGAVQMTCDDVIGSVLFKTRETAGGFWVNAPRDVFEHYSRAWLNVMAEDFTNSLVEFPSSPGAGTTPDGRWTYTNASAIQNSLVVLTSTVSLGSYSLRSNWRWQDTDPHACWRAETYIVGAKQSASSGASIQLAVVDAVSHAVVASFQLLGAALGNGIGLFQISDASRNWPAAGLNPVQPPWEIAVEARDRWVLYYLNGQLVGSSPRNLAPSGNLELLISGAGPTNDQITVDYAVVRRTSPPMNAGTPGDYFLPSAPAPGGLNGEYFDLSMVLAGAGSSVPNYATILGSPTFSVGAASQPQTRVDQGLGFGQQSPPTWQLPFVGGFGVRWTGSIYLPLGQQDVVFQLPAAYATNGDFMRVWVGRTRAGEQILTDWPGDTVIATSVGMRSLLGSVSGWYPLLVEYYWASGGANPGFTYNVGGAGTLPSGSSPVLAGTGATLPTSGTDSGGVGSVAWSNPGLITAADGQAAVTGSLSGGAISHWLVASGFGFGIPSTATIVGIQVDIKRYNQPQINGSCKDYQVSLMKAGSVQATNYATATLWSTGWTVATYGGSSDLWGGTWTPADVNNSGFGAVLAVQNNSGNDAAHVDYIEVTVYYTTVAGGVLSPLGLFHQQVRNDSHYDMLRTIADDFVYQFKSTPRALESGSFPGSVVPQARVGRDTDKILDSAEGLDPTLDVKAKDVAATLLSQASGLGGANTGNLSVEAFNYPAMAQHPYVASDLENLPQHTFPPQLVQNLISLLGYRSAPFEDLQSKQIGARSIQDTFPLTGALAEFDWQPGDGLRVWLETLFVKDVTPRQILSLQRMLFQDGMGDCVAALRPRIRSPENTIRRFVRQVMGDRRTFQGQVVSYEGTHVTAPNSSEIILPADLSTIRQALLVVMTKTDGATSYNLQVNGTTVSTVTARGILDIGQYVQRNNTSEPRMLVALTGGTAATYCVQLRVLIPAI